MCIICVSPKRVRQPNVTTIRRMFQNNPDGAGYMFARDGKVTISKGFMNVDEYIEAIRGEQYQAMLDEEKEQLEALRNQYDEAPAEEKQSLEQEVKEEKAALEKPVDLEEEKKQSDGEIVEKGRPVMTIYKGDPGQSSLRTVD